MTREGPSLPHRSRRLHILQPLSERAGTLFPKIGLPLITGYLFVGALAGPFVLNLIHKPDLQPLSVVTQFALAFISFSAGSELYLPELRSLFKRIAYATTGIAVVTFILCTALITAFASGGGIVPFMEALPLGCRASVASIAAAIMVARSPASAIAVVKELKAKGTFTSTILGVTVLGDVFVLMLFTITTTIAESECKGEGFSIAALGITVGVIIASIIMGYFLGHFLLVLMMFKRIPTRYLILPLGLCVFVACHAFTEWSHENLPYVISLEPLLICIMAGYVCSNKSKHRHRFIGVLQQAGPYVFLPFFTLTGASLDLRVMVQSFGFAALTATVRGICIFVGSSTGHFAGGEKPYRAPANMLMWMSLLTQAGVSLGLASEVGMSFPEWGRSFQTAIIAVVLVNQLVGPILFKVAVRKMGEAGKANSDDAHDVDAAIPTALVVGYSHQSVALATRLLNDRWNVSMVCANEAEAACARSDICTYALEAREAEEKGKAGTAAGMVSKVAEQAKAVAGKAGDAAMSAVEKTADALASGGASASTPATDASASNASKPSATPVPVHHEHEHETKRKIEEDFTALGLLEASVPLSEHVLVIGAGEVQAQTALQGGIVSSGGTDYRYMKLVEAVSTTKTLAAVVFTCPTDAANYSAIKAVQGVIAAAPKRSPLHAVRLLAFVQDLPWTPAYEAQGVVPIHGPLHTSVIAAKLVAAQRNKPIVLMKSSSNQDELVRAAATLLQGPHLWKFGEQAAGTAATAAGASSPVKVVSAPPPAFTSPASPKLTAVGAAAAAGTATAAAASSTGTPGGFLASMESSIRQTLEAEEVGGWDGAREEYIDSLHGLNENTAADAEVLTAAQEANIEDVQMFGFLGDGAEEAEAAEEQVQGSSEAETAGSKSGLATQWT